MPTVIKAAGYQRGVDGVAFDRNELAAQAELFLAEIRNQARQILETAALDAQRIRQAAEAEGRRAGEQAFDRLLDEKLGRQLETVMPALRAAVAEICDAKQTWLAHWERQAVQLSAAIAGIVCRRELSKQPEIAVDLVREALELATSAGQVRVLMHPDDHAALEDQVRKLAGELGHLAPAEVVADATISRGGCRVETPMGAIDQQMEIQLARIVEELAGDR